MNASNHTNRLALWRSLLLRLVSTIPSPVRQWAYRQKTIHRLFARLLKKVIPLDRPVVITIPSGGAEGARIYVDRETPNYYWLNSDYEKEVLGFIRQKVQGGDVVADIGAHIGLTTLAMSLWVGPDGLVLSFEPHPSNFQRLRSNCDLNAVPNVRLFPLALTDRPGTSYITANASASSRLTENQANPTLPVDAARLDSVLEEQSVTRLALMKIDVEGSEAAVLRGAQKILLQHRPALVIEVHSQPVLLECMEILQRSRYHVQPLSTSPTRPAVPEALDRAAFALHHIICQPQETIEQ